VKDIVSTERGSGNLASFVSVADLPDVGRNHLENMRRVVAGLMGLECEPPLKHSTEPCSVCAGYGEVWGEDDQGRECLVTCYQCIGRGQIEVVKRDPVLWRGDHGAGRW